MVSPDSQLHVLRPATRPRHDRGMLAIGAAVLVAVWLSLVHASWLHYDAARARGQSALSELARDTEADIERLVAQIVGLMDAAQMQLAEGLPSSDLVTMLAQRAEPGRSVVRRLEIDALDSRPLARVPPETDGILTSPEARRVSTASRMIRVVEVRGAAPDRSIVLDRLLVDATDQPVATMRVEIAVDALLRPYPSAGATVPAAIDVQLSDGTTAASSAHASREFGDIEWIVVRRRAAIGETDIEVVAGIRRDILYAAADRRILAYGILAAILSAIVLAYGRRVQSDRRSHAIAERALAIATGSLGAIDASIAIVERSSDRGDPVIAANAGFLALLGRSAEAVLGRPWTDVVGATGAAWLGQLDKPIESRFARPDGETSWLEIRLAPIAPTPARGPLVLVSIRDITLRKQTELAMLRAKNQAEIANRAKSDFLANMSHELRTPLNAILGFSEIISKQLLGPVGTAAYKEYANDIWVSGSHLLNIISDILDFAKIEAATLKLEESEIDLARLLGTCVRFMAGRSAQARVEVVVDVPAAFPRLVADDLRLKQIVLNLLGNAVKFSPPDSVVTVSASLNADGGVDLSIADRGCGMSPSDVEAALQPFRQIESTMVKRAEGTGLGLPLAKRLIELHGGRLLIETALQVGTTVTVRLPATRAGLTQAAA